MKKAIIYGGAFNPPTKAHQSILQACVDEAKKQGAEVWLLPSGNRTDKTIAVPIEHRLHMLDALIRSIDSEGIAIKVEDIELQAAGQTETFQTYQTLYTLYPEYRQIWVFGSDSVQTMPSWGDGQWLYDNLHMLITERLGHELSVLPPGAQLLPIDTLNVSSTMVRDHVSRRKDFAHLVPELVHKTIVSLGLFL